MRRHVFASRPKYCVGFKPGLIKVRCRKCGLPHLEYFGPKDRNELAAEIELLRRELTQAFAILSGRHLAETPPRKQKPTPPRTRRRTPHG